MQLIDPEQALQRLGQPPRPLSPGTSAPRAPALPLAGAIGAAGVVLVLAAGVVALTVGGGTAAAASLAAGLLLALVGAALFAHALKMNKAWQAAWASGSAVLGRVERVERVQAAGRPDVLKLEATYLDPRGGERHLKGSWSVPEPQAAAFDLHVAGGSIVVLADPESGAACVFPLDYPGVHLDPPARRAPEDVMAAAFEAHRADIQGLPDGQAMAQIQGVWWSALLRDAHEYADLVAAHPQQDGIAREEARAVATAYLCGYLARRGWVEENDARLTAFVIGRGLRDQLRGMGVSIDQVPPSLGTVMNRALERIVEAGLGR